MNSRISARAEREQSVESAQTQNSRLISTATALAGSACERYPLSHAQQRLWFLSELAPGNAFYNVPGRVSINGVLSSAALEQSLGEIVRRHQTLRTQFRSEQSEVVQVVLEEIIAGLETVDLRDLEENQREEIARRISREEARRGFDLSEGPLFRTTLVWMGEQEYVLLITLHHIIADGWSQAVLVKELSELYERYETGEQTRLEEPAIQYGDYAVRQREWFKGEVYEKQLTYWRERLKNLETLQLPTDHPRPPLQSYRGAMEEIQIEEDLLRRLREFARRKGATLYMVLLGAFVTLLHRYSRQNEIVIGSPIANRNRAEIESLIGFFVNTLVLRVKLTEGISFEELIGVVREVCLGAYGNPDLPFEKLVDELQPERDLGRNPLFQVMFVMVNASDREIQLGGARIKSVVTNNETAKFDLQVFAKQTNRKLEVLAEYSTDLYKRETISRWLRHYATLLEAGIKEPSARIDLLEMLSPSEVRQLVEGWNETEVRYDREACIHQLIEEQARENPDRSAVACREEWASYRRLNGRANQLGRYLQRRGVGPERVVGLCIERSVEMVVGLLGIVKSGGAYLPLDSEYPPDRLRAMVQDAGAEIVICGPDLDQIIKESGAVIIKWDEEFDRKLGEESEEDLRVGIAEENLFYVMFTSGSTGRPKGAMNTHRGLFNRMMWMQRQYSVDQTDRILQKTPFSFDVSGWEFFWPLMFGACLEIAKPWGHHDPEYLMDQIRERGITTIHFVPSMLDLFLGKQATSCTSLRRVICSGEALPMELVRRHSEALGAEMHNLYGPTEAAIDVTYWQCQAETAEAWAPIGRPIANAKIYILDGEHQPSPIGVTGEIFIGGVGLARGYSGRADLTGERFLPDPYSKKGGERVYKSGDVGKFEAEGLIKYVGRTDNQIKIRGLRIELGEIETLLNEHPGISQSAVIVRQGPSNSSRLVAYVVPDKEIRLIEEPAQETSSEAEQVAQWAMVFDDNYSGADLVEDHKFDIRGWKSSYTGMEIPRVEMEEWVAETIKRIQGLRPERVLEIGCGTGLLMWRIAPQCVSYCGTDFSEKAVRTLQRYVAASDLKNVSLLQRPADDFRGMEQGQFDLIIVNSVAQYFPNIDYLKRVIEKGLEVIAPGGKIFIGDIRSLPIQAAFYASIEMKKSPGTSTRERVRQNLERRITQEEELVIDPRFFVALKQQLNGISNAEISPKRGRYKNELSCYRYDVVLHTTPPPGLQPADRIEWNQRLSVEGIRRLLEERGEQAFQIRRVKNARVELDHIALNWVNGKYSAETLEEFESSVDYRGRVRSIDPEDLYDLGDSVGRRAYLNWSSGAPDGSYDVIFQPSVQDGQDTLCRFGEEKVEPPDWSEYANNPLRPRMIRRMLAELRGLLSKQLPEHMVPAGFVVLERLPLNPNGKLDRKALGRMEAKTEETAKQVAPRTVVEEILAGIWSEVLDRERTGVTDDFFEIGGNSLIATQVISRARAVFRRDMPLRQIFETPSIQGLAQWIEERVGSEHQLEELRIERVLSARAEMPLSYAQQRLWFLSELAPGNAFYNVPGTVCIHGDLSCAALEQSLQEIVRRHEVLRTHFVVGQGGPVQIVDATVGVRLEVVDLQSLSADEREQMGRRLEREEAERVFDLEKGPLFRARLLRSCEHEYSLLQTLHHIVSDGWSHRVLVGELSNLYESFGSGDQSSLEELQIQYADFAIWQREWLNGSVYQQQLEYWRQQLDEIQTLQLPADHPRPPVQTFRGAIEHVVMEEEALSALRELARREEATLFMVLLAGFVCLLRRYSGQREIVIGTPIANRNRPEIEGLIGFFVNSLVLRVKVTDGMTYEELVKEVREICLGAYAHQDFPFERLVDELQPERDLSRNPLFQVMFVLMNTPAKELRLGDARLKNLIVSNETAKFDLAMFVEEREKALYLEYSTDLYERETIQRILQHYVTLLRCAAGDPKQRITELEILSASERRQLLDEWNATGLMPQPNNLIHQLFEQVVRETPDRIAVVSKQEAISYAHLNARANQLAGRLLTEGAVADSVVGICMERSLEMVAAQLAILKAGAAYLPLDPAYPQERIRLMVEDSQASMVVTQHKFNDLLGLMGATTLLLETLLESTHQSSGGQVRCGQADDSLAYVIYTSGSSGKPKGAMISHRSLVNHLSWIQNVFPLAEDDALLVKSPISFDASVWEVWAPLLAGARIVVAEPAGQSDARYLVETIIREQVTTFLAVPTQLMMLLEEGLLPCSSLRRVFTGAEPLTPELARLFFEQSRAELINLYGPTEATIYSTYWRVPGPTPARIGIGRAVSNSQVFVLDEFAQPVPIGVPGELLIGGQGLARGYIEAPQTTAERFVPNPFSAGARLYRTGDNCRFGSDGVLEFIGRKDHQVKLRGFRIELGEVEAALLECEDVADAIVIVSAQSDSQSALVGYIKERHPDCVDTTELKRALLRKLPAYMVPGVILKVDSFPMLPNGKVNRRELLTLAANPGQGSESFVAAESATEKELQQIWQEILFVDTIGVTDNFFESGGHSLLALRLVLRLQKQFGTGLTVTDFFGSPTIRLLAAKLDEELLSRSDPGRLDSLLKLVEELGEDEVTFSSDAG